jgi:hypothetical protein
MIRAPVAAAVSSSTVTVELASAPSWELSYVKTYAARPVSDCQNHEWCVRDNG